MPATISSAILPSKEAIRHFDAKGLKISFDYRDVIAQEHAIAFTVAKMMDEDMLAETHVAISDALKNGTDFNDFKKRLKPYLMSKGWWGEAVMGDPLTGELKKVRLGSTRRLRTIYHTNLHTAYAAGRWERIQQSKKLLPYLQYMPSQAAEPRQAHQRFYGLVRPVDDPIWSSIMPPNGYGCLCWIRQLTRREAVKEGISKPVKPEYEEYINKRTGEVGRVMKHVDPGFAHNHDRLTALRALYGEKARSWGHVSDKTTKIRTFERALDEFMLDLVAQPDFNSMVPTVVGTEFARRFNALATEIGKAGASRKNSMAMRKTLTEGDYWVVATIPPSIQAELRVDTALIRLSDDTPNSGGR